MAVRSPNQDGRATLDPGRTECRELQGRGTQAPRAGVQIPNEEGTEKRRHDAGNSFKILSTLLSLVITFDLSSMIISFIFRLYLLWLVFLSSNSTSSLTPIPSVISPLPHPPFPLHYPPPSPTNTHIPPPVPPASATPTRAPISLLEKANRWLEWS